jgi:hypothetical protein
MFIDTRFTKIIDQSSLAPAEIRRHLNGSIDLDHYVQIGREAHGAAFRARIRSLAERFQRFYRGLLAKRSAAAE